MSDGERQREMYSAEAAWAHNRWPTIGLYTGAGTGLVLGVVTYAGLWRSLLYIVVLATVGCLLGFLVARMVYGRPAPPGAAVSDEEEEAK